MNLFKAYLTSNNTRRVLSLKPGEKGFSLIELVVVIAVLAVLTAIALPNFLGVSEDASARTAQQGALNAFKECKVFWARNKRSGVSFNKPGITDWVIGAVDNSKASTTTFSTDATKGQDSATLECFTDAKSNAVYAYPDDRAKFPAFWITSSGERLCKTGNDKDGNPDTYNVGCDEDGENTEGTWQ